MSRRTQITAAVAALSLGISPLAAAQSPPSLRPSTQLANPPRVVTSIRPSLLIPTPTLRVNSSSTKNHLANSGVAVVIGGIQGATAYHVAKLDLGCGFDQEPLRGGVSAQRQLFPEYFPANPQQPTYTTDRQGRVNDNDFDPASITIADDQGLPVEANGTAVAFSNGTYGVWGKPPIGYRMDLAVAVTNYNDWMLSPQLITPSNNTCEPKGVVFWKSPDGVWRGIDDTNGQAAPISSIAQLRYTRSSPWFLRSTQRIVIEETSKLEAWGLRATMQGASLGSVCEGVSWGPAGEHTVGIGKAQGDFTFTLRSGPIGNRCAIALTGYQLPEGVTMASQTYSLSRVGDQCHIDASATLPLDVVGLALMGAWSAVSAAGGLINWIVTGETDVQTGFSLSRLDYVRKPTRINTGERRGGSVHGWRDPYGFGDPVRFVGILNKAEPQVGLIECNMALSNDNAATLRLDRVVLNVPIGMPLAL